MLDEIQASIATDFDMTRSTIQFEAAGRAGDDQGIDA